MSYTIAGKKILNEYIALGVYGLTGLGAWAATRGGSEKKATPELDVKNVSTNDDEAAFIANFINDAEHEAKMAAKH